MHKKLRGRAPNRLQIQTSVKDPDENPHAAAVPAIIPGPPAAKKSVHHQ